MPTLAADRIQGVLYLAPGLTPATMTRAARAYVRHWHRKRQTAVLVLHGDGYTTTTALWPDGLITEQPTVVEKGHRAAPVSVAAAREA